MLNVCNTFINIKIIRVGDKQLLNIEAQRKIKQELKCLVIKYVAQKAKFILFILICKAILPHERKPDNSNQFLSLRKYKLDGEFIFQVSCSLICHCFLTRKEQKYVLIFLHLYISEICLPTLKKKCWKRGLF